MTTTKTRATTIRLPTEIMDQLKAKAKADKISLSALIERAVYLAWSDEFAKPKPRPHGQRWHQCGRCGGWNVGDSGDGVKRCADCGWSSEEK